MEMRVSVFLFLACVLVDFGVEGRPEPLKFDEVVFSECDKSLVSTNGGAFDFKVVKLVPVPVLRGKQFTFNVQTLMKRNFSCADFLVRVSLTRSGLGHEEKDGSDVLCDLLSPATNSSSHPGRSILAGDTYTIEGKVNVPPLLESGIYSTRLEIRNESNYNDLKACVQFQEVVSKGFQDYASAAVAFAVAAAASWQLGKAVTIVELPLITGYLFVGMVVGPYVCNLVTEYHVYLIGGTINNFALSFIAFAAGEEIYLPALRPLLRAIKLQMGSVTFFSLIFSIVGFLTFTGVLPGFEQEGLSSSCWGGVSFIFSVIMVARSPATIVAVLQEMGGKADPKSSKLVIGITVVSDIVVLIGFGIAGAYVSSVCPVAGVNGYVQSVDLFSFALIFLQFLGVIVCGGFVGAMLYCILSIPFQRLNLNSFVIYRSHMKGALIIPFGCLIFYALNSFGAFTLKTFGRQISIEPLMVCMVGSSIASHRSEWREQFANILEKFAPYVFLPFFTLTGASLKLDMVLKCLPLALVLCACRLLGIYIGSSAVGARYCLKEEFLKFPQYKHLWLTLLSQAGVAFGLALEVREKFPRWGDGFQTLTLSVVILNQFIGPPLAKVGFKLLNGPFEGEGGEGGTVGSNASSQNLLEKSGSMDADAEGRAVKGSSESISLNPDNGKVLSSSSLTQRRSSNMEAASSPFSMGRHTTYSFSSFTASPANRDRIFSIDSLFEDSENEANLVSGSPIATSSPSTSAYIGLARGRSRVLLHRQSSLGEPGALHSPSPLRRGGGSGSLPKNNKQSLTRQNK